MIRAGPPVPELSLSESFVMNTANLIRIEVNKALHIARTVALGKDFKLFLLVSAWHVSSELGFQARGLVVDVGYGLW